MNLIWSIVLICMGLNLIQCASVNALKFWSIYANLSLVLLIFESRIGVWVQHNFITCISLIFFLHIEPSFRTCIIMLNSWFIWITAVLSRWQEQVCRAWGCEVSPVCSTVKVWKRQDNFLHSTRRRIRVNVLQVKHSCKFNFSRIQSVHLTNFSNI